MPIRLAPPSTGRRLAPRRSLRSLTASLLLVTALGGAIAQETVPALVAPRGDDPVLVRLGATTERASTLMDRFEIAVRGLASSQGLPYDANLLTQVYGFLPTFLQQRATELVLIDQARVRGITIADDEIDAIVARVRGTFADDAAYGAALLQAGFRDEAQLRELVVETELMERVLTAIRDGVTVSDDEVTIAYFAQRLRFTTPAQVCLRHILVADEARALAMVSELAAGSGFGDLARAESIDTGSALRGGELGCIRQGMTVAPFDAAAFAAELDTVTGPVQTQFGYHLLQVYEVRPGRVSALDEVREELVAELRAERADLTIQAIVATSGVLTFPESIPPVESFVEGAAGL
jgi:peptidyl-prolyl cis-trans isomerase C